MKIAVTGYCGTGSSAVVDLLMEYENCTKGKLKHYEHIPLYTPNGLFDLEDKLLIGNNLHRSDEALESFKKEMIRLDINDFGWFGAYRKNYNNRFKELYTEFINELTEYSFEGKWSYDFLGYKFSMLKSVKDIIKIVLNRPITQGMGLRLNTSRDNIIKSSFITKEQFYFHAKRFVKKYMELIAEDSKKNIIFDHLLLPHNLYRIPNYFEEDFRVIVVDRDVRDMYVLSKYVWPSMGLGAPFPKNPKDFVKFWRSMRECEKYIQDKRILRINFEDLIYKYEDTVNKIENFLGIDKSEHIDINKKFIPQKSIKNTQNYLMNDEWCRECKYIEQNLSEYIYKFPYKIETSLKETFDT